MRETMNLGEQSMRKSLALVFLLVLASCSNIPSFNDMNANGNTVFSVLYNGNGNTGGSVPVDGNTYISGESVTAASKGTLAKSGFTFVGWNTAATGSGLAHAAGSAFGISSNLTLYAQWTTDLTFSVTYNGNGNTGGSVPVDGNAYISGASVTAANKGTLAKSGFTFAGWNTAANGSGMAHAAGSSFGISSNVTLYAQWTTVPTFSVTYNGNGNTGGSIPVDGNAYISGASVTVANKGTLTKSGFIIIGWNTAANGTGTVHFTGSSFEISSNVTLYAQWTADSTSSITDLPGTEVTMITTPDITTSNTFPTGRDDSGSANVPARFIMGEAEVTYELWYEVYKWATTDAGGGKRADGGVLYVFVNAGREGNDGTNGAVPTAAKQEPVTSVYWRDSIVWCNAITEYYNANNGSETDLVCVYTYSGSIIRDSRDSNGAACDNAVQNSTAKGFRLPTSNESEYAARYIGTTEPTHTNYVFEDGVYYTKGNSASGDTQAYNAAFPTVDNYAVYNANSGGSTAAVKTKTANALGLCDMSGNVSEWCFDWNPKYSISVRMLRGGNYSDNVDYIQVGDLSCSAGVRVESNDIGFRICRTK